MVLSPKTLTALAFAGLLTRPAMAAEEALQLTWRAPAPCPDEATFRAEIEALARKPSARETRPALTVSVIVTESPSGAWQARIATLGGGRSGERIVSDARCEDVARAVALVLALALNPTEDVESATPFATRTAAPYESEHVSLGFDLIANSGTLPEFDLAAQSRLALELMPVSIELRIAGFLPESESISAATRARAEAFAVELGAAGCYGHDVSARIGVQGCAGVEVDWLRATSSDVAEPGSASGVWPSPFLEGATHWAVSDRAGLRLAAQVGRGLDRPRFAVTGDGVFFTPSPYLFRLGFGAEMHF